MTLPPFIMTAALLFWGFHTGLTPAALVMALMLEPYRLINRRWDFNDPDFNRMADICTVIIVGLFVYFLNISPLKALFSVIEWLPATFFPLMVMHQYSTRRAIRVSAVIWMLRRAEARGEIQARYIDLAYPYLAVCVIAAGIANERTAWFYPGIIILAAWVLFPLRSKRYPVMVWIVSLAFIGVTGFGLHTGMHTLQRITMRWYYNNFMKPADPTFAATAIGDIGDLKPSGRIVFRVKKAGSAPLPPLLTTGVYNLYFSQNWAAMGADLKQVEPGINNETWPLVAGTRPEAKITVALPLRRGKGVLKLPADTIKVINLPAGIVRRNRLGAVQAEDGPGLATYTAITGIPETVSATDRYDVRAPPREIETLRRVVRSLGLKDRPPAEIVTRLHNWFQKEFSYSLKLRGSGKGTEISDFLLRTRSGHCEYFATATVLLLRVSGIPARYAKGYAVPRGKTGQKDWIPVRDRHAHAWAEAFIGGKWLTVDTTPPGWIEADSRNASMWEPVYNRLSDLYFNYARWRWGAERNMSNYLLWLLVPMVLYLGRNLFRRRQTQTREQSEIPATGEKIWPGADSAFYRVEQALLARGYERFEGEALTAWLKRIVPHLPDPELVTPLRSLLALHYKYRFDPLGLRPEEKERLTQDAGRLLSGLTSKAT